ncbi:MAG: heme-binding domain-containing protein, partial [Bacteroidota bacterium]|nr:heme-binding domain-containing protein [Bacteroidota bacterium]
TNDITAKYTIPADVSNTLKTACYDCHSNHSEYPWYWSIQPVAWFMDGHINEGKHRLNFSEFAAYKIRRQYKTLDEINKEIKSGDMPLTSYTLIHRDAVLSDSQKLAISHWTTNTRKAIEAQYPPDSLKKK